MLEIFTGRMSCHGVKGYRGPDALNITRGSGGGLGLYFAPSRDLLNEGLRLKRAAKKDAGKLAEAWSWYETKFIEEMRAQWKDPLFRGALNSLLGRKTVTLLCYCGGRQKRCHRFLVAESVLVKLGATYMGERPKET